jgi:flagellar export protein FliJ
MPEFQFRLSPLLTVRRRQRELRQTELADALGAGDRLEAQRAAVESELRDQHSRTRAGTAPGRIDAASLGTAGRYESELRTRLAALATEQVRMAAEIEQARQTLIEADRDVRALEKLRDRRFEEFQSDQRRAERALLDEMSLTAAQRGSAT